MPCPQEVHSARGSSHVAIVSGVQPHKRDLQRPLGGHLSWFRVQDFEKDFEKDFKDDFFLEGGVGVGQEKVKENRFQVDRHKSKRMECIGKLA